MAFWPQQVLSPAPRDHEPRLFGRDKRPHCAAPYGYYLLASLSSGSALGYLPPPSRRSSCPVPQHKLPTPVGGFVPPHPRRSAGVACDLWGHAETFAKEDGTMNSDTPSRGFRGSSIEDTDDKEGVAGAAHDRLAEDVSSLRADITKMHESFSKLCCQKRADMPRGPRAVSVRQSRHK